MWLYSKRDNKAKKWKQTIKIPNTAQRVCKTHEEKKKKKETYHLPSLVKYYGHFAVEHVSAVRVRFALPATMGED